MVQSRARDAGDTGGGAARPQTNGCGTWRELPGQLSVVGTVSCRGSWQLGTGRAVVRCWDGELPWQGGAADSRPAAVAAADQQKPDPAAAPAQPRHHWST